MKFCPVWSTACSLLNTPDNAWKHLDREYQGYTVYKPYVCIFFTWNPFQGTWPSSINNIHTCLVGSTPSILLKITCKLLNIEEMLFLTRFLQAFSMKLLWINKEKRRTCTVGSTSCLLLKTRFRPHRAGFLIVNWWRSGVLRLVSSKRKAMIRLLIHKSLISGY